MVERGVDPGPDAILDRDEVGDHFQPVELAARGEDDPGVVAVQLRALPRNAGGDACNRRTAREPLVHAGKPCRRAAPPKVGTAPGGQYSSKPRRAGRRAAGSARSARRGRRDHAVLGPNRAARVARRPTPWERGPPRLCFLAVSGNVSGRSVHVAAAFAAERRGGYRAGSTGDAVHRAVRRRAGRRDHCRRTHRRRRCVGRGSRCHCCDVAQRGFYGRRGRRHRRRVLGAPRRPGAGARRPRSGNARQDLPSATTR